MDTYTDKPDELENECSYCGDPCLKTYCSSECRRAYECEN